jgi:hypothetical protein
MRGTSAAGTVQVVFEAFSTTVGCGDPPSAPFYLHADVEGFKTATARISPLLGISDAAIGRSRRSLPHVLPTR